jgi:MraZ protein
MEEGGLGMGPSGVFLGTFTPRLDEKGRLILPAKFRPKLATGLVCTRGLDRCVFVFPIDEFHTVTPRAPREQGCARLSPRIPRLCER